MARCSVGLWVLIEIYVKTLVFIILFLILVIKSKTPAHIVEAGDLLLPVLNQSSCELILKLVQELPLENPECVCVCVITKHQLFCACLQGQQCSTSKGNPMPLLCSLGNVVGNPDQMIEWKSSVFQQVNFILLSTLPLNLVTYSEEHTCCGIQIQLSCQPLICKVALRFCKWSALEETT